MKCGENLKEMSVVWQMIEGEEQWDAIRIGNFRYIFYILFCEGQVDCFPFENQSALTDTE